LRKELAEQGPNALLLYRLFNQAKKKSNESEESGKEGLEGFWREAEIREGLCKEIINEDRLILR